MLVLLAAIYTRLTTGTREPVLKLITLIVEAGDITRCRQNGRTWDLGVEVGSTL